MRAAIALAPVGRVLILTKADPTESNTGYAQGGIAAAIGADDSPELHAADTMRAGDGLCDAAAVKILCDEGPRYVRELIDWGTRFDRDGGGRPALGLEAAHSVRRILHAGDSTGREIGRTLWERARALGAVQTVNHALVTGLLVEDGIVRGVHYFDSQGRRQTVRARADAAGDGRRRPGVSRDHQSRRGDRRRHRAGVRRRRARLRPRVRAVPSDGAEPSRRVRGS